MINILILFFHFHQYNLMLSYLTSLFLDPKNQSNRKKWQKQQLKKTAEAATTEKTIIISIIRE